MIPFLFISLFNPTVLETRKRLPYNYGSSKSSTPPEHKTPTVEDIVHAKVSNAADSYAKRSAGIVLIATAGLKNPFAFVARGSLNS